MLLSNSPELGSPVSQIVEAIFGNVPDGLLGVMKRLGDGPFSNPGGYRTLHDLIANPAHRQRAKVLLQIGGPLNETTVQIVREIDLAWARVEVVKRLPTMERMREFQQAVRLIQSLCPEVSCDDLSRSFEKLEVRAGISTWAQCWLRKITRLPATPPISDGSDFRCLRTGADIQEAAKRFKNCLMNKLPEVVLGRLFYVEYQPSLALIELLRLSKGEWVLEGLHGPANALEPEETVRVIVAALSNAGILIPMGFAETAEHGSAALLLGLSDFDRHWANVFMR